MTRGAGFALDREGDIAGDVLAEIVDRAAFGVRPSSRDRRRARARCTGVVSCGIRARRVEGDRPSRCRRSAVSVSCARVVDLAEIDAATSGSAAGRSASSRRSRATQLCRRTLQLGDRGDLVAPGVDERLLRPHHLRAVPAVAEPDVDGVARRPAAGRRRRRSGSDRRLS